MTKYTPETLPERLEEDDEVVVSVDALGLVLSASLWIAGLAVSVGFLGFIFAGAFRMLLTAPTLDPATVLASVQEAEDKVRVGVLLFPPAVILCSLLLIFMGGLLRQIGRSVLAGYSIVFSKKGVSFPGAPTIPWSDLFLFDVSPGSVTLQSSAILVGVRDTSRDARRISFTVHRMVQPSFPPMIAYALYRCRDSWAPGHEICAKPYPAPRAWTSPAERDA
ncbi:hypothetical protein KAJ83_16025 [Marivibrio halodurans]|uniref:Uncharacterized protein n=1 Tax=Marivibrio halodurans TaxID=2039722 RepID=A0A8J7S1H3_9PROT|nr:hypothetical protein [Marivibrio halodurans]MBP5858530.1 hypothetical protein [Marivibrio halodurans]